VERAIYLDYNATAPMRQASLAAMQAAAEAGGNPSSVHRFGRTARRRVEDAREQVAALIGAQPAQIVFTGGGTEANNLALKGVAGSPMAVAATEHDSVLRAAPQAPRIPVDGDGIVDLAALSALLQGGQPPALISVMLANNETGVIQPLDRIVALARAHGALVHCDAVQAAGKMAVDFAALGVDLMSLSAHKLGGPMGVGALAVADGVELAPLIAGGGQERRRRAGTENVPGIAGFGAAAEAAAAEEPARLAALRDDLEARARACAPWSRVFGTGAPRLPNTTCLALPGVASDMQVMALDLAGIAVSAGSACSSGKIEPSHVLRAMGAGEEEAGSALRISFGWASEPGDVDRFIAAWSALAGRAPGEARRAAAR